LRVGLSATARENLDDPAQSAAAPTQFVDAAGVRFSWQDHSMTGNKSRQWILNASRGQLTGDSTARRHSE
jgi:hypothetical protein